MKNFLKCLIAKTPYRIIRRTAINRFQANIETLASLRDRGLNPPFIIDGGANVGDFAREAWGLFPHARLELIEPQPGCKPYLDAVAKAVGGQVHDCALVADCETKIIGMRTDASQTSTGAHIADPKEPYDPDLIMVPAKTLDDLLGDGLKQLRHGLLKLDLQGHELEALKGASQTLERIDVILTEVSLYRVGSEPTIAEVIGVLAKAGFELHDIASISARRRDNRAYQADFLFVRNGSSLTHDTAWQ